ncbi:RNA-binding protein nrd1 [Mycena kentingensis (nom. inval.)]|nr:RNA-binding protein nrd1 [Mycena kentingensis (nom. inval.)]
MDDSQATYSQPYSPYGYDLEAKRSQMDADKQKTVYSTPPQLSLATDPSTLQQQQAPQQAAPSPIAGSPYAAFSPYNMLAMGQFPYAQQGFAPQSAGAFSPQRLPALNIPAAQAVYNPAALSGLLSATATAPTPGRTVYIGNLPPSASVDELLNLVHFGPLESIRVLPEKSCVFLSFLDASTAAAFFADATLRKLTLHAQELKIGWGKPSPVPAQVMQAIAQSGASRNVYLGGLDENMTEEQLRDELSKFGLIDQVKIVRDKNIGFVHFLSISIATKVVNTLPTDPAWAGKRVNYGKDRCAYVPKSQQAAAHQAQAAAAQSLLQSAGAFGSPIVTMNPHSFASPVVGNGNSFANGGPGNGGYASQPPSAHPGGAGAGANPFTTGQAQAQAAGNGAAAAGPGSAHPNGSGAANPILSGAANGAQPSPATGYPYSATPFSPDALSAMMGMGMFGGMMSPMSPGGMGMLGGIPGLGMAAGNRTVYLGNIHPETSTEDLCNAIRGGVLQSIRYMMDKHIAFITFIDPAAAFTFFQVSSYQGLTLNNRRLKIGWGKNSGPLPPTLALAVHAGATRNVYIGNVEDFEVFNEERLRADFGEFGDIELVNFLKEKNCAFVNFTNISNAIKAIDAIKARPEYANLRIAHGKDRCANPPRSGPQGGGRRGAGGGAGGGGPMSAEPVSAVDGGEVDFDAVAAAAEMGEGKDEV